VTTALLKILDLFKPIYLWQGVDYAQLRAIVGIKLEMDNRRVPTYRVHQTENSNATFAWTVFIYFILGGALAFLLAFLPSLIFAYSIYHAYLMVMIIMTLVSDFSAVLLDTSDNTIVLPRPITNKTFYAARATHILLYIGLISLALAIGPIVITFFIHGTGAGLAAVVTSFLTVFLSVALTNGFYLLLMRFTTEDRLKNVINYFQIGMTIFMMGGYQMLPRLFTKTMMEDLSGDTPWWSLLIPPMWMANTIQLFKDFQFDGISLTTAALALLFPFIAWWAINRYLTPYFTQKLADLGTASARGTDGQKKISSKTKGNAWASSIARTGLEKAAFNLASFGFSRDRKLKLRIYPALGYLIVLIFVFIFRARPEEATWVQYLAKLASSETHLIAIYACIYLVVVATYEIHFTDDYKASWIFQSAPLKEPGYLLIGTMKSIFLRFFVPMYAATSLLVLLIWKANALIDLIFGFCASLLLILIMGVIAEKHLPLSLQPSVRNQGGSMARAIITFLILAVVGGGHYLLAKFDFILWIACPVFIIVSWMILKLFKKLKWEDIEIT
jgi:ABC-2 type transport system permease protein